MRLFKAYSYQPMFILYFFCRICNIFYKIYKNIYNIPCQRAKDLSAACGRYSENLLAQRSKKARISVSPQLFSGTARGQFPQSGEGLYSQQLFNFRFRRGELCSPAIPKQSKLVSSLRPLSKGRGPRSQRGEGIQFPTM